MRLKDFIKSLSQDELEDYAVKCATSSAYMRCQLVYGKKTPRKDLLVALSEHSNQKVSYLEVLQHFGLLDPVLCVLYQKGLLTTA